MARTKRTQVLLLVSVQIYGLQLLAQDLPQVVVLPLSVDSVGALSDDGSHLLVAIGSEPAVLAIPDEIASVPTPTGASQVSLHTISGSGVFVAGYVDFGNPIASIWSPVGGWVIPTAPPFSSVFYAISSSETALVGEARFHPIPDPQEPNQTAPTQPFLWTAENRFRPLGSAAETGAWGRALGVSFDGGVVAGECARGIFRWTETSGIALLDEHRADAISFVRMSEDGSTIIGRSARGALETYRWTSVGGFEQLGAVGVPIAASGDCSIILGVRSVAGVSTSYTWTATTGSQTSSDFLVYGYGLTEIRDWTNFYAGQLSGDGRTICGAARSDGAHFNWCVRLPTCCDPSDMNCDRRTNLIDLAILLSHFGECTQDDSYYPKADIDRRGCVDLPDLAVLLSSFGTSCDQ